MMTLQGGWNDQAARSARPAEDTSAKQADDTAPISAQRCLPLTGPRVFVSERRAAARTQLGMPAVTLTPDEPSSSAGKSPAPAGAASPAPPPARRGPPPLPARFAVPKVIVAARPLLPDTVPARRLQLQDVTYELDTADLLPLALRRPAVSRPGGSTGAAAGSAAAPGGVRGVMAAVLVRLLALLAPSLQLQPVSRGDHSRRSRQRV